MNDTVCDNRITPLGLAFGIILTGGIFLSYIPQHVKLFLRRTNLGLSYIMLLCSLFQNFLATLNVFIVHFPTLQCCATVDSPARCQEHLLPIYQLGVPFVHLVFIYIWALLFFRPRIRSPPPTTSDSETAPLVTVEPIERFPRLVSIHNRLQILGERYEFRLAIAFYFGFWLVALALMGIAAKLLLNADKRLLPMARACGLLSAIFVVFQWLPQIFTTARAGHPGSLSIIMLIMQTPGGVAVVVYNTVVVQSDWSTWLPFLLSAVQQAFLLTMCLVFMYRERQKNHPALIVNE